MPMLHGSVEDPKDPASWQRPTGGQGAGLSHAGNPGVVLGTEHLQKQFSNIIGCDLKANREHPRKPALS